MRTMQRRTFMKLTALGGLGMVIGCKPGMDLDVIIRNGLILDGLGGPGLKKDIGIRGKRIAVIDDLSGLKAKKIIDASNLVVSPGFIDIHTHTDSELLVNGNAESKIHQGVTTEVGGNCGASPFPLTEEEASEYHQRLKERYGLTTQWHDLDGFFSALEKSGIAINFATLTGHGDLRAYAVGRHDVPPDAAQMKHMQALLIESVEQGSFGLSTGLEYAPGSYASTEELIELTSALTGTGAIYASHMRNEDDRVEEAIEETLRIGREADVYTQISHLKACNQNNWHKVDHMLELIAAARKNQPVMADRYPYNAWGTGLSTFLPLWARQGDTDEVLARLNDAEELRKIKVYSDDRAQRIGGWDRVLVSSCSNAEDRICEGKTILEGAREKGMEPFEYARSLLLNSRNGVSVIGFAMDEENLKKVLTAEFVMIGSDGNSKAPYGKLSSGNPHPRHYGTFPRVLGKYVREERVLTLSTAVKKMTSMPAEAMGFKDRGILKAGYRADLVLFDPEKVADVATYTAPHQYAVGIETVLVNGVTAIEEGRHTGSRSGEVIRRT